MMKELLSPVWLRGLLSISLLTLVQLVSGQQMIEILHLKNGSKIKGMIIEQVPNVSIKIQTSDGSVFVYQISEVEKITKEVVTDQVIESKTRNTVVIDRDRSGFVNVTELSYGIGVGDYSGVYSGYGLQGDFSEPNKDNYVRLTTVNGMGAIHGLMSVGLGVGVEYYYDTEVIQIPLFVDIRLMPVSGNASPSIVLQGGYSINSESQEAGLELAGGIGIDGPMTARSSVLMTIMYDYQEYSTQSGYYYTEYRGGSLRMSLGFAF